MGWASLEAIAFGGWDGTDIREGEIEREKKNCLWCQAHLIILNREQNFTGTRRKTLPTPCLPQLTDANGMTLHLVPDKIHFSFSLCLL